jgi:calcineurin-like phosphoesterase family protein
MNQSLIVNWNSIVNDSDLIFILGDFSMHNIEHYMPLLNGNKVLIKGNHDRQHNISSLLITSHGTRIYMQHKPYLKEVPENTELILCGHVHDKWRGKHWNGLPIINVGVDVWDYKPVSLDAIRNYALTLPNEVVGL